MSNDSTKPTAARPAIDYSMLAWASDKAAELAELNDELAEVNADIAKANAELRRLGGFGEAPADRQHYIRAYNNRKRLLQRRIELEDEAIIVDQEIDLVMGSDADFGIDGRGAA